MVAAAQERPVGLSDTWRVRMAGARLPPVPGRPDSPAAPPPTVGGSKSSSSLASSSIWSSAPASVMYLRCRRYRAGTAGERGELRRGELAGAPSGVP